MEEWRGGSALSLRKAESWGSSSAYFPFSTLGHLFFWSRSQNQRPWTGGDNLDPIPHVLQLVTDMEEDELYIPGSSREI